MDEMTNLTLKVLHETMLNSFKMSCFTILNTVAGHSVDTRKYNASDQGSQLNYLLN